MRKFILFVMILSGLLQTASAQETKKEDRQRKNTVHINITNPLIFGSGSIVLGYERLLRSKKHSISINIGLTSFPDFGLIENDSLKHLNKLKTKKGLMFQQITAFISSKKTSTRLQGEFILVLTTRTIILEIIIHGRSKTQMDLLQLLSQKSN
jgi:hypothetical protein